MTFDAAAEVAVMLETMGRAPPRHEWIEEYKSDSEAAAWEAVGQI